MKIQINDEAGLSLSELLDLEKILHEKRRQLVEALDLLNRQLSLKDDCSLFDAADAATRQEDRLRSAGIAAHHRSTIAEIDQALERMQDGRFGLCEMTGQAIARERLLSIPWARKISS